MPPFWRFGRLAASAARVAERQEADVAGGIAYRPAQGERFEALGRREFLRQREEGEYVGFAAAFGADFIARLAEAVAAGDGAPGQLSRFDFFQLGTQAGHRPVEEELPFHR